MTVQGADIYYFTARTNELLSLREAYNQNSEQSLNHFVWMFREFNGRRMAQDVMCVELGEEENLHEAITELDSDLRHGIFETLTIDSVGIGGPFPIELSLTDDAKPASVGKLKVQFCPNPQ